MNVPMRFRTDRYEDDERKAVKDRMPGDVWALMRPSGSIAGYVFCCPKCGNLHSAINRPWVWTGSAEQNTLTATPSLSVFKGCDWHGFLTEGVFVG